jgi:hypothetical protein
VWKDTVIKEAERKCLLPFCGSETNAARKHKEKEKEREKDRENDRKRKRERHT